MSRRLANGGSMMDWAPASKTCSTGDTKTESKGLGPEYPDSHRQMHPGLTVHPQPHSLRHTLCTSHSKKLLPQSYSLTFFQGTSCPGDLGLLRCVQLGSFVSLLSDGIVSLFLSSAYTFIWVKVLPMIKTVCSWTNSLTCHVISEGEKASWLWTSLIPVATKSKGSTAHLCATELQGSVLSLEWECLNSEMIMYIRGLTIQVVNAS